MKRFGIIMLVLVVALSGLLPAALYTAHRREACEGRGHCRTCHLLEAALLLLRLLLPFALLAAPLSGNLLLRARVSRRRASPFLLSPVARKVRLNN